MPAISHDSRNETDTAALCSPNRASTGATAGKSRINTVLSSLAAAPILLPKVSMTRKRFKLGLAALCLLTAFVMAVIGLLLAPTLASAGKNNETGHQHADESDGHGALNPIYLEHSPETEKATWNAPPAGPCVAQSCNHQDDALSYEDGSAADQGHSSSGEGGQGGNPASDAGHGQAGDGFAGGFGGGSSGGFSGGPSQGSPQHVGSDDQDESEDSSEDKSKSGDSGPHDGEPEVHVSSSNDPYHDPSH